jgi:hypothetical protein
MPLQTTNPAPSITAAVIAYLQQTMANALGVSATNPGIWRTYTPDVVLPYAIVSLGVEETYQYQSNDPAQAGYWTAVIARGVIFVSFVATSEVQALALARQCVRSCVDTIATLLCVDGAVLELRPVSSRDDPLTDIGPSTPTVFRRTVMILYAQEFPL